MDLGPPVAIAIAVASGLVTFLRQSSSEARAQGAAEALIEERFETMKEGERAMHEDLKEATTQLREVATQVKVVIAEQSVIQRLNMVTLQSLTEAASRHDRAIAEHGTSISLIREIMGKQMRP